MINKLAFLVIAVFTLFLNSCAIPAALIGGGGTLYGLHKVAKHHYPNAVPDLPGLPSFSNILESSTDHNGLKSHFETNPEYGFDCTKKGEGKNQSECFDQFARSFSEKKDNIKTKHKGITTIRPSPEIKNNAKTNLKNITTTRPSSKIKNNSKTKHKNVETNVKRTPVIKSLQVTKDSEKTQDVSPKVVASQKEIEESVFFEDTENNPDVNKPDMVKEVQVAQNFQKTPVASTSKTQSPPVISNKKLNKTTNFVSSQLLNWAKAWENQDIILYMSFYSKEFRGAKNSRSEWETHRRHALKINSNITIQISNIQAYKNKNIIEANFIQRFKSDSFEDVGIKELIWKENENGWKIIKETWMPSENILETNESDSSVDFVSSQLLNWLKAWGSRNINLYISFYSKDFKNQERSRIQWEAHRHRALKANSNISIQVSNIQIHKSEKLIEVSFIQHFKSDTFEDVGTKKLVWRRKGTNWKILKETWIPS